MQRRGRRVWAEIKRDAGSWPRNATGMTKEQIDDSTTCGVDLRSLIVGGFARRSWVVGGLVGAAVLLVAPRAVAAPLFSSLPGSVSEFSVDASTGALTPVAGSPFPADSGSNGVTYSPSGGLLATSNYFDDTVSMFAVDATTGALTQVANSPFSVGTSPHSVSFSPAGGLLATANSGDNTVSVFTVDATTG